MKELLVVLTVAWASSGCATLHKAGRGVSTAGKAVGTATRYVVAQVREVPEDVTPRTPYQKKVLASSLFPGGGWIYECNVAPGPCEHDVSPGVAYFLATVGTAFVLANQVKTHSQVGVLGAAAGLTVIRFGDVVGAMRAAKRVDKK